MTTNLTGLEELQHMLKTAGGPPIAKVLGFRMTGVGPGWAEFEGIPDKKYNNPGGTIHGGWAATIMDSALACAIHSQVPAGKSSATIELKLNYIRPITAKTGLVTCRGEALHIGRQIATSEAKIFDGNGKLLAHGTTTCAIFKAPQKQ